jgi:hypothetical protein
MFPA